MTKDATLSHEIIADIKRIASETGKADLSRRDYYANGGKFSERQLANVFNGWGPAIIAAGLQRSKPGRDAKKPKVTSQDLFGADIREIVKPIPPEFTRQVIDFKRTLFIGDAHFPFVCQKTLSKIYELVERNQYERVVQLGDLYDMFAHGKFPRSRHVYNPHEEMQLGFEMAQTMWATIRKLSPGVECLQILGNHDIRPIKRIIEAYPEGEVFFSIDKFFQFEGVTTHMDTRKPLDLGFVLVLHGTFSKLGDHAKYFHRNVICGHSHRMGIASMVFGGETLIEVNAGFIGDSSSKALAYTPYRHTGWTLGCVDWDQDGPRLIKL